MNLLSDILNRLNQRIEVGNIFDEIYGLSELVGEGNDKAWATYIGNGQAIPVTNYDAKQGTLFWVKRGKTSVTKNESFRLAGCKSIYETKFSLTAYAMVRKSHLPCDGADAQDWVASRVLRLISGTDPDFKVAIGVVAYEVVPSGYASEARYLPKNYDWAAVAIDIDVNVSTTSEDGCYDTCATGDIPLPDFEPCVPCLTEVAVDGLTITGNGTEADPLVAIGGGGGTPLRTQDEGVNVSTNTVTLNFTGGGVTASLTSPGVVQVNVPGGAVSGVTAVTGTAPIASSGGATPDISIPQATASVDGFLDSADFATFAGKQDALSAGTGISIVTNTVTNTAPDQVVGISAGTGISVSGSYPNFTIDNTAPDQIVSLTPGAGINVSGTYPNFSVTNTAPSSGGTVTSVALTMPAAFSVANSPVTSSGTLAITGAGTTAQYIRGDGSLATLPSMPTIYKSTTDGTSITAVSSEQISASQLIPANTFAVGDIIRVTWRVTKTGTASAITCKLYVNTSVSLVGALQQGVITPGFTNSNSNGFQRHLIIKSSTNTQNIGATASTFTDYNTITTSGTSNIDWTVNQYLIFMCQLNIATADNVRTSFYLIEKL